MKQITYVTGNPEKIKSAQALLGEFGIEVIQAAIDTPEIQANDAQTVAINSAKYASKELDAPVLKMDVGFYIEALNGFPGPYIKQVNDWISPEKVLRLLDKGESRKAYFGDVICFCAVDGETKCFELRTSGIIANEPSGDNGWAIDKIFIPDGFGKTLASMSDTERLEVWRSDHWAQLAEFLKEHLS